jgi:hypothetical protein
MPAKIKGTQLLQGETTVQYSVSSTVTTVTFTGPQDLIDAQADELWAEGYRDLKITSGPTYKLVATKTEEAQDPGTGNQAEEPEPTWQLQPNVYESSLYECGRPLAANIPTAMKELIEYKIKNPNDIAFFPIPPGYINAATLAQTDRIYAMRRMGLETRQAYSWTLSRTITVSRDYDNLTWTIDNALKVLSTAKVQSLYAVPSAFSRLMPASGVTSETVSVPGAGTTLTIPFYLGWLEQPPTVQTVDNNTSQISQAWIYNRWNVTYAAIPGLYDVVE